jgi:two-component system, OmpR family, phosphate regulon sensor histidine kinase PhoR
MQKKPINKIVLVIILALFVPILTYTVYQFVESDDNEQLIKSIYDRQLESILYSVNQYCWDIFSNWQSEMTGFAVSDVENFIQLHFDPKIGSIVQGQRVVAGAFLRISEEYFVIAFEDSGRQNIPKRRTLIQQVNTIIAESNDDLDRSIQFAKKEGYIKPLAKQWNFAGSNYTLLIFPILNPSFEPQGAIFGGLLIDNLQFIQEIVARRFSAMTEGEFIFAVQKKNERGFIYYSTEEKPSEPFDVRKDLWILPDLELKVKMAGTTLARMSRARSQKNLLLLAIVNIVFIIGLVYVVHNVTKEMEIAKIKSNLVANVSHEIRTPVALIRMYAETLEMGRITDESKKTKYYKTILAETVRLSQLINNMLDFSKIESRKKQYRLSPGNLGSLTLQVLDMYQHNLEQKDFAVAVEIEPRLAEVNMDAEAVTQALVNLLDNAMKYSSDDKYIGIVLKEQAEHIVLSVTDHGIGIPESEFKKIFQKFYRVGDSLVHNTKGSGLGLSLVEHIMNVHNGRVELTSSIGHGSTFSLIFPKLQGV